VLNSYFVAACKSPQIIFIIFFLKEDEVGRARSTNGGEEECI
jgi:hypothetical protein